MAKETTTENATEDTLVFDSMPGGDKKDPQGTDSFTVDLDFSEDTTTEDIDPVATEEQEVEEETKTTISADNGSLSDELAKLNSLRESGVLTQEEFEKAKNKLLTT